MMHDPSDKVLIESYKVFDIVSDCNGNVGIITEVGFKTNGENLPTEYSVVWIVGKGYKTAWYSKGELNRHCNVFTVIAEQMSDYFSRDRGYVKRLMEIGNKNDANNI